jgi:hypothetical protein
MTTQIHKTLTDKDGNTYRIVESWWLKALTIASIVNFVILMLIIAGLIDNVRRVEIAMTFSDKWAQRNGALSDIAASRAEANIWAFKKTCEWVLSQGQKCFENPQWYADPKKYPLIVDDPAGAGLFPPK